MNRQAAHLSQSLGVDLEGTATDEPAARGGDEERRHTREILLGQLLGKQPDQVADRGHVALSRGPNFNTRGSNFNTQCSLRHPSIIRPARWVARGFPYRAQKSAWNTYKNQKHPPQRHPKREAPKGPFP